MKTGHSDEVFLHLLIAILVSPATCDETSTPQLFSNASTFEDVSKGYVASTSSSMPFDSSCIKMLSYVTPGNPDDFQVIDTNDENSVPSYWNPSNEVKIIVCGFCQDCFCGASQMIKDALLKYGNNVNVLVLNYNCITGNCSCKSEILESFVQAVINSKIASQFIVNTIEALDSWGKTTFSQISCIGHSLGAQVCAGAATNLMKKGTRFYRIDALDPAPHIVYSLFHEYELSSGIADYVFVMHTSPVSVSTTGDIDVYINGGLYQLICSKTYCSPALLFTSITPYSLSAYAELYCKIVTECIICSHVYAYVYYALSVNKKILAKHCLTPEMAVLTPWACNSYDTTLVGPNSSSTAKGAYAAKIDSTDSISLNIC